MADIARFEVPKGWRRSSEGVFTAGDSGKLVTGWPWRDFPILERIRAKRSNSIPEGSLQVTSYASTEAVDFFRTRVTMRFMDAAWPRYMSNPVQLEDGSWTTQGNLRYMHQSLPAGFCREYQRTAKGYLCRFVIPPCFKEYQEQVKDGALTGTSLGFSPDKWERSKADGEDGVVEFLDGEIAEQSLVDAPATPGCNFQEMAERARHALGWSPRQFQGVTLPSSRRAPEPEIVADAGPLRQSDLLEAAERFDEGLNQPPPAEESAGGNGPMNWTEINGFLCADLRPEGDFIADTLRYSAESLEGIVRRGGKIREELRGNDYDGGDRIQRICFNKRAGDGYSREEAELLVSIGWGCHWWDGESGASLADMPAARSKDSMFQRVIGKLTGKEPNEIKKPDVIGRGADAGAEPHAADTAPPKGQEQPPDPITGKGSPQSQEDDMDEKALNEALQRSKQDTLDAIKGLLDAAIPAAVKPVADGLAALAGRVDAAEQRRAAAGQAPVMGASAIPTQGETPATAPFAAPQRTGGAIRFQATGRPLTRADLGGDIPEVK